MAEIIQPLGGTSKEGKPYGNLIRSEDAALSPSELVTRHQGRPAARPAMDPEVEQEWDRWNERHRSLDVIVTSNPKDETFEGYWCAKRYWPRGATQTKVSPMELKELEAEGRSRITVVRLFDKAPQVQVPAHVLVRAMREEVEAKKTRVDEGEHLAEARRMVAPEAPAAAPAPVAPAPAKAPEPKK